MVMRGGSTFLISFLILLTSIPGSISLSFNFASFKSTKPGDLTLDGDAIISGSSLDLNRNASRSAGRALYPTPLLTWAIIRDDIHGNIIPVVADFSSHFTFNVSTSSSPHGGGARGGLSFVIAPPQDEPGVAVVFEGAPDPTSGSSSGHVGIYIASLNSKRCVNLTGGGFRNKGAVNVWVDYNSTTKNLSVSVTFARSLRSIGVFHILDLMDVLPDRVQVGFTASSSSSPVVIHRITSWSFTSHDLLIQNCNKNTWRWVGGGILVVIVFLGIGICLWRRYISRTQGRVSLLGNNIRSDQDLGSSTGSDQIHDQDDDDVGNNIGPDEVHRDQEEIRSILANSGVEEVDYSLIEKGTNGFDEHLLLGKGSYGSVFRCSLSDPERQVAVKKMNGGFNQQGLKDFNAELRILSKAKHQNVVQLVGWSRGEQDLCLCFELMPNKNLDRHLHGDDIPPLTWEIRYKVIVGVASGVEYLHTRMEQYCVIHRDIKPANVLLDAQYNAKVADFGTARFTERNRSMKTTTEIGTRGYVAREILQDNQKASTQSDVYSFGMLLLEVVTGERPGEFGRLIQYVRDKDNILEAVDGRLGGEYNPDEAIRVLDVGLRCCLGKPGERPTMTDVLGELGISTPRQGRFSLDVSSSIAEDHVAPTLAPALALVAAAAATATAPALALLAAADGAIAAAAAAATAPAVVSA